MTDLGDARDRSGRVVEFLKTDEATMILVNHQRAGIMGCGCGWADLGRSHPRHVLEKLIEAFEATV